MSSGEQWQGRLVGHLTWADVGENGEAEAIFQSLASQPLFLSSFPPGAPSCPGRLVRFTWRQLTAGRLCAAHDETAMASMAGFPACRAPGLVSGLVVGIGSTTRVLKLTRSSMGFPPPLSPLIVLHWQRQTIIYVHTSPQPIRAGLLYGAPVVAGSAAENGLVARVQPSSTRTRWLAHILVPQHASETNDSR